MSIPDRIRLFCVFLYISFANTFLECVRRVLFLKKPKQIHSIVIFKVGNIGDITCAIPSFIAIRRAYPNAHITLLTSPGDRGGIGARELLAGAWYIDALTVYYLEDIKTLQGIKELRGKISRPDLFIQLPDDYIAISKLVRNMLFARYIGSAYAFGFLVRSIRLFQKIQVDSRMTKTETESLLDILNMYGIPSGAVEFDLPITVEHEQEVNTLIHRAFVIQRPSYLVAMSPSCKRAANRWPIERFGELAKYLVEKYDATIVVIGGKGDGDLAESIGSYVAPDHILNAVGTLSLLGSGALLKRCSFLIANSTGTIHLAAAVGIPCLGLYSVRDILGRWFPYGQRHKSLYKRKLLCDYRDEECIYKSMCQITLEDAREACDQIIQSCFQA